MSMISNDPTTGLAFSMHENPGVFAILIGSGLSRSASIPTGWDITLKLIRKVGLAKGVPEQSDWAQWYADTTGNQPNYSTLLEDLAQTQAERRAVIEGFLEPTAEEFEEGLKVPTPAHRAIAEMIRSGHIPDQVQVVFGIVQSYRAHVLCISCNQGRSFEKFHDTMVDVRVEVENARLFVVQPK